MFAGKRRDNMPGKQSTTGDITVALRHKILRLGSSMSEQPSEGTNARGGVPLLCVLKGGARSSSPSRAALGRQYDEEVG